MEKMNKTIEHINKRAKDLDTFKSLVTNLMQWTSQLDFDINYHTEKLEENPNDDYHREQLKLYTDTQNERIKMAEYVIDEIMLEYNI